MYVCELLLFAAQPLCNNPLFCKDLALPKNLMIHWPITKVTVSRKDAFVSNKPAAGTLIIDDSSRPVKSSIEFTGSRNRIEEKNELAQKMLSWTTNPAAGTLIIDDSSGPVKSTGSRKRIKREK